MAFITGLFLIDAKASALNNGQGDGTGAKVKAIRNYTREGAQVFPYVSAQSYRYWLRTTLEKSEGWQASPVYTGKGKQQAYTEGDPIRYADDDLFGYMRAVSEGTTTRVSPLRTSTLVSIAPAQLTNDFGVMARVQKGEGDKQGVVLHQHEFYMTALRGLFSLDLNAAGTFTSQFRTGYQNLTKQQREAAHEAGYYFRDDPETYRLPTDIRLQRIETLLQGMARIEGGANQTLHYTDVTPVFVIAAITRGGNNIFANVITTDNQNNPMIHEAALREAGEVFGDEILSPVYIGRAQGYMDSSQPILDTLEINVQHPRHTLNKLASDIAANPNWLE
jgi:CRISPR-associated protein Cst2